jgi:hypothetical protein
MPSRNWFVFTNVCDHKRERTNKDSTTQLSTKLVIPVRAPALENSEESSSTKVPFAIYLSHTKMTLLVQQIGGFSTPSLLLLDFGVLASGDDKDTAATSDVMAGILKYLIIS